jgi:DNA replication protein DnaC
VSTPQTKERKRRRKMNDEMNELDEVLGYNKKVTKAVNKMLHDTANIPNHLMKYKILDYKIDNDTIGKLTNSDIIKSRIDAKNKVISIIAKLYKTGISGGWNICFFGKSTSGKSLLATLILRELIMRFSERGTYFPFNEILVEAKNTFLDYEREEFLDKYIFPTFLLIDDIYIGETNERVNNLLAEITLERTRQKKITIITSSASYKQLSKTYGKELYLNMLNSNVPYDSIVIKTRLQNK